MTLSSPQKALSEALYAELTERILPYWIHHAPDEQHGGFVGAVDGQGRLVPQAEKGAVLNARILWTFATAFRLLESSLCRNMADRAYEYLTEHFWDSTHGGVYWMVDSCGGPVQPKKHVYAQAFAVYAFTEYHRATGHVESLKRALRLFELLEHHAHDSSWEGYIEAFGRDWCPLEDMSLGAGDPNVCKSMNTTLHVLEAYTNLHRVRPDEQVEARLGELIELFLHRILDRDTYHLQCFFDRSWRPQSERVSYGHDVEASWLLTEAATELGNPSLQTKVESVVLPMVEAVLRDGVGPAHGLLNEARGTTVLDADRHWWPQAEAMVGFVNAYEQTGKEQFLEAAQRTWAFIEEWMLDRQYGEWYFRVSDCGEPYPSDNKVGPWKGPYHNARACFEILERTAGSRSLEVERSVLSGPPRY